MADNNDEVIVTLSGDTSTMDVKIAEEAGAGAPASGTAIVESFNEDPVADLKNQFAQMTGRVAKAESVAQTAVAQVAETQQRLQRAEAHVVTSQIDTVDSGIAAAEQEAENAERAYAQAFEAGDGPAMARAQRVIARAENNRAELVRAKQDLQEAARRQPTQAQQPRQQARQPAADPVEAVASTLSQKSAAWLRSHPECVTDPKMNARMMAAHNLAVADDVAVDSDEYFRRIEAGVKVTKTQQQPEKTQQGDGRRPSSAAASGSGSGGNLNGGITVALTKGERDSATDGTLVWNYDDPSGQNRFKKGDPIGLAEMARRKYEGKKAGLYDRNSIEA